MHVVLDCVMLGLYRPKIPSCFTHNVACVGYAAAPPLNHVARPTGRLPLSPVPPLSPLCSGLPAAIPQPVAGRGPPTIGEPRCGAALRPRCVARRACDGEEARGSPPARRCCCCCCCWGPGPLAVPGEWLLLLLLLLLLLRGTCDSSG